MGQLQKEQDRQDREDSAKNIDEGDEFNRGPTRPLNIHREPPGKTVKAMVENKDRAAQKTTILIE
jgi:hypothetical protein